MKIVLDTNVLFDKWFLTGPQFELLRRHTASGRSTVVIPSVVVLELENHYQRKISEHIAAAQKLNAMLPPGAAAIPLPSPEEIAAVYGRQLRDRLSELGFQEVHFTEILHDRLIEKAIKRRKPFADGGTGYRDALIWEMVLRHVVCSGDITYLVTENYKDFATDNKKELHPYLRDELRTLGFEDGCVMYVANLSTLIDLFITPDMPAAVSEEKFATLRDGMLGEVSFVDWINDNAEEILDYLNKTSISLDHLLQKAEEVSIANLEFADSFDVDSVSVIDETSAVVIGTTEIEATVNFFVHRSDYYLYNPPYPFSAWNLSWSDHYIAAEATIRLSLRFVFSVSLDRDEITEFEVDNHTELWGYCKRCGAIQYSNTAEVCRACHRRLF
jgi:PIN domain